MAGKLFTSAVALLAAVSSGCAMCENCDDYGSPVVQDSFEGIPGSSGRVGSVLSGTVVGPVLVESQGSSDLGGEAGSGTRN